MHALGQWERNANWRAFRRSCLGRTSLPPVSLHMTAFRIAEPAPRCTTAAALFSLTEPKLLRTPHLSIPATAIKTLFAARTPARSPIPEHLKYSAEPVPEHTAYSSFQVVLGFEVNRQLLPRKVLVECRFYPGRRAVRIHNHRAFDLLQGQTLTGWKKGPEAQLIAVLTSPTDAPPILSTTPKVRTRPSRALRQALRAKTGPWPGTRTDTNGWEHPVDVTTFMDQLSGYDSYPGYPPHMGPPLTQGYSFPHPWGTTPPSLHPLPHPVPQPQPLFPSTSTSTPQRPSLPVTVLPPYHPNAAGSLAPPWRPAAVTLAAHTGHMMTIHTLTGSTGLLTQAAHGGFLPSDRRKTFVPSRVRPILNEVYVPFGFWRDLFEGSERPFPAGGLPLRVMITGVVKVPEQSAHLIRRATPYGYYVLKGIKGLAKLKGKLMVRWNLLINGVVEMELAEGKPVTHVPLSAVATGSSSTTAAVTASPPAGSVRPATLSSNIVTALPRLPVPQRSPSPLPGTDNTGTPLRVG